MTRGSRVLVALVAVWVSACGSSGGEGAEPGTGTIPTKLSDIEGTAEDAFDQALLGKLDLVTTDANTIDTNWLAFRAQAATDGAAAADLTAMDQAIAGLQAALTAGGDNVVVARAANAISGPMDELFALYDPAVPPALLALDYLGREVVLDAKQADWTGASAHVATIESTFAGLKASVVDAGGQTNVDDYAASVAALKADITAKDAGAIEAEANVGLELVDAMEGLF